MGVRRYRLYVTGMDCPSCAKKLESGISQLDGCRSASVVFSSGMLYVEAEPWLSVATIQSRASEIGFAAQETRRHTARRSSALEWVPTAIAGILAGMGWLIPHSAVPLFVAAAIVGAMGPFRAAIGAVRARTADINVLMLVAVVGAIWIGDYAEAAAVSFLFSAASLLERRAADRSRRSIEELISLEPETAWRLSASRATKIPAAELEPGDVILIKPGERVPADAVVTSGRSTMNRAPITGESLPVDVAPGGELFAGCLNGNGALEAKVTARPQNSKLSRIVQLVEQAQAKRSRVERQVDRFARTYTPAVIVAAVALTIIPPLLGASFEAWLYRSLTLLVVSCPCALVLSTPVSVVSAMASAARRGILVKGGAHLETLAEVKTVVFDKTGTLTLGRPVLAQTIPANGFSEEDCLADAAAVESRSEHPLALAVTRAARERGIALREAETVTSHIGLGARGALNGYEVVCGSPGLPELRNAAWPEMEVELSRQASLGRSVALLAKQAAVGTSADWRMMGMLAFEDALRPEAGQAVEALRELGVEVAVLSGDRMEAAAAAGDKLGVAAFGGALPEEKLQTIQQLKSSGRVCMVGDGVNDAAALAAADCGVAFGAAASDTALSVCDVAVMGSDLRRIPQLLRLARRTRRTIRANIALSVSVKLLCVALAVPGWLTMWMAVVGDMGISLLVSLNGLSLLRKRE